MSYLYAFITNKIIERGYAIRQGACNGDERIRQRE